MKRYLLVVMLLGCAAFMDNPDDYERSAPAAPACGYSQAYPAGNGVVFDHDGAAPEEWHAPHVRRL